MTASGSSVSVAVEHVCGVILVELVDGNGDGLRLAMTCEQADALAACIAERVCDALDACEAWTAAGVAALAAHANGGHL